MLSLQIVHAQLTSFAAQGNFIGLMQKAFGSQLDLSRLDQLRQQWLFGNFGQMPEIKILSSGELGTANAAYGSVQDEDGQQDLIFFAADFLANATENQILSVLLEEYGHSLDLFLNSERDSQGDEGEIFAHMVMGRQLSDDLLAGLRSQNDHGFIIWNGVNVAVEYADIFGDGNNNFLNGSQGDDNIFGNGGNDVLNDGDDNPDLFIFGNDSMVGGEGNDTLTTLNGEDILRGGNGNDHLIIDSINILSPSLYGEMGDDTLILRSSQGSYLAGGAGNDTYEISITATNYFIEEFAREGTDTVNLSNFIGAVAFSTSAHLENVIGGAGNDTLTGGTENNQLSGNNGNDSINGAAGHDTLDGGLGNDTIRGGIGNDFLTGAQGNDHLYGEGGNDSLYGGVDNDTYWIDGDGDAGVLIIGETFDGGIDAINFSNTTSRNITVNLTATVIQTLTTGLRLNNYTLNSIENITGGSDNDTLIGHNNSNVIRGGEGNDFIDGRYGLDTMDGGNGIDTIDVTFFPSSYALNMTTGVTNFFGEIAINFENINTGIGNDTITGSSVANTINLGGGNDIALGNSGNDTILGGAGNDTLNGGIGNDTLIGGSGNDTYIINVTGDVISETSTLITEIDTVESSFSCTLGANLENLILTGAAINGVGNTLNNRITGNNAANTLNGGAGNDILNGGLGNDSLNGGIGNDTLSGGTGVDTFVLNKSQGIDRITDFATGEVLRVSKGDFGGGLVVGALTADRYISGVGLTTASTANQRFILNTSNGALYFDIDGNTVGGLAAVQIAIIQGVTPLATNFKVVA